MGPEIFELEVGIQMEINLEDEIFEGDNPLEYRLTEAPEGFEINPQTGVVSGKVDLPEDPNEQAKMLKGEYELKWQIRTADGWDEDDYSIEYRFILPEA